MPTLASKHSGRTRSARGSRLSLRTRVLAIALVPSIAMVGAGVGLGSYLIANAVNKRDTASLLARGYRLAVPFMPALSEERRASIAADADPSTTNLAALGTARHAMDGLMAQFAAISGEVAQAMPAHSKAAIEQFMGTMAQMPEIRRQVDTRQAPLLAVYDSYNHIADTMIQAAYAIGADSTDRDVALLRSAASGLMADSDWLARSNALAAAAYTRGGMTADELAEFLRLTGAYRQDVPAFSHQLPPRDQQAIARLLASPAWTRLTDVADTLAAQGPTTTAAAAPADGTAAQTASGQTTAAPVDVSQWQDDARTTASALSGIGLGDLGTAAAALEKRTADRALLRASVVAGAALLLAALVLVVAVRMGNELVRRLRRLRRETLLADDRLPDVLSRIRQGVNVDAATAVPPLDFGSDEIGEVATAFSKAQQSAVAAALQEARLREGTNTVFLNIARRSQALLHRQLQVLDRAERATDDPDQVELLFQLDHLSTRERRNAENLIVLGGGQLARQWRAPVPLIDVVRSAVSETEQYHRVSLGRLPQVLVDGRAVADVIHMLAELVDNATEFSPPDSRIEVRGHQVGRGVALEVEDQGIGIEADARNGYNAMFRDPPDFSFMTLTQDTRIGFFVVARLAQQHQIRVTLDESPYGGVRAIVLLPTGTVTAEPASTAAAPVVAAPAPMLPPAPPVMAYPTRPHAAAHDGALLPDPAATGPASLFGAVSAVLPPQGEPSEPQQLSRRRAERAAARQALASPNGNSAGDRPPLPRRRRQSHLVDQLREEPLLAPTDPYPAGDPVGDNGHGSPEEAQRMMAAFQRGTERGRSEDDPDGSADED